MKKSILLATVICTVAHSANVQAQLCLKPRPTCRAFFITELGFLSRVNPIPDRTPLGWKRHYFTSDLGIMMNMNMHYAIGVSNFIGIYQREGLELHGGPGIRVRKWLSQCRSVDLSLGLLVWELSGTMKTPAFAINVCFNVRDWLALSTQLEVAGPISKSYTDDVASYIGLKAGSSPGLISNALLAMAGIVYVIAVLAGQEN